MKPFLYQIAELFYAAYGAEVSQLTFVFPNRRAGLFFQKYLSSLSERPLFSPKIATIHDLFMQLSGKQAADRIRMLFKLYELYGKRSGSTESFDEFLYWGEMLLNDFDDVDKYMVDARMLFRNLSDLKELDEGLDFLSEEQVEAIRMAYELYCQEKPRLAIQTGKTAREVAPSFPLPGIAAMELNLIAGMETVAREQADREKKRTLSGMGELTPYRG